MAVTRKTTTNKKTTVKKPVAKKPAAKKAVAKKPVAKKPAVKKAVAKKPAAKKPVAKKAVAKKPVAKKPAAKKVVAKKPAVKQPAAKAPAKKPAIKPAAKSAVTAKPVPVAKPAPVAKKVTAKAPEKNNVIKSLKVETVSMKTTTNKAPVVSKASSKPKPVVKRHKLSPIDQLPLVEPYVERAGEDYMNAEQRQHFRNILNQWKQDLMQEVDRTVDYMKDEAANYPDPADRATQEEEFNLELRTRDRERKLIKKIDEAMQRIEDNDYGYCEACGIEIGTRRLEARPTATLCIDCKTVDEIREKQLLA
ncbi:MAG: RNA polymerase-binding protein DksA [Gammaproteobacteria bacterium]|nr:RNA polymerase-binding protein DksA [Gammaproteobacteria bacterium]